MPTLDDLNRVVAATRVLATPDSGYPIGVAVALAEIFKDYAQGAYPDQLEPHVLNLADAIMHPLAVGA